MKVTIRKPYSTITEMFKLEFVKVDNALTDADGNFMRAYTAAIGGSTIPATTLFQLLVSDSSFSNMKTAGNGGVFYFDLGEINPKVETSSFDTI